LDYEELLKNEEINFVPLGKLKHEFSKNNENYQVNDLNKNLINKTNYRKNIINKAIN
jgi:hypothetical protein